MKKINLSLIVLCTLVLVGCGVSQQDAESTAVAFIQQNVQFFAKEGQNQTVNLPTYDFSDVTSYKEGGNWIVVVHVVSTLNGTEKTNDLSVMMDSKGVVTHFNGRALPP